MKISNPPFSAQLFQAVYGAQPQLVGASPSFYDFVTGSLPTGVTLTRASSGYRYNSAGVLVSEATDVARFQYDPVALTPRGLLIEGAATNLLTYSEEFDNAAWSKPNATVSANAVAASDGTTTADAIIENTVPSINHGPGRTATVAIGTYVIYVRAKPDTRGWVYVYLDPARVGGSGYTYFNVSTGAVGTVLAGATAFTQLEANGLYSCTVIATATSGGGCNIGYGAATGNGGASYAGVNGASGLYMWGAGLVAGNAITSYIKTTSAAVTRAADVALITNANVLADQCWIIRGRTPRRATGGDISVVFQVDDGTDANRRIAYYSAAGNLIVAAADGDVTQSSLDLGAVAVDTDFTIAARFADNNFAASLNGGAIVTDTSGTNPLGLTTARIGRDVAGYYWNSTIRTIETRRTASDTELPLLAA